MYVCTEKSGSTCIGCFGFKQTIKLFGMFIFHAIFLNVLCHFPSWFTIQQSGLFYQLYIKV